jgi:hypothetical protein
MIRLLAIALTAGACSGGPDTPVDCNGPIYGARVQSDGCLPPVQIWIREHALFDGPNPGCSYAAWFPSPADECTPLDELIASCPLSDGYSAAEYHVVVDYDAGAYLWDGAVRAPGGGLVCAQSGGGVLTVVR